MAGMILASKRLLYHIVELRCNRTGLALRWALGAIKTLCISMELFLPLQERRLDYELSESKFL